MNAIPGGAPNKIHLDGQWEFQRVGSDHKVYYAVSSHDCMTGGMICQYDPNTQQIRIICPDLNVFLGTSVPWGRSNGKLHSDLTEYNGYLYFSTYYGYEGGNYAGGHVMRYKLGSLEANAIELKDFGIPVGGGTIYTATCVDPIFGYVWVNSDGYICRYNWDGNGLKNFGYMGGNCFYHFTDSQGNLWTTSGSDSLLGYLIKVDPNGVFTYYPDALPLVRQPDNDQVSWYQALRFFLWGDRHGPDKWIFSMGQDGHLYEFDAAVARAGNMAGAIRDIARIGISGMDSSLVGDTVYFMQGATPWDGWSFNNDDKAKDQHLKSVNVITGAIKDLGRVVDQDGRTPWRAENQCCDGRNVYCEGDWRLRKGGWQRHPRGPALHLLPREVL